MLGFFMYVALGFDIALVQKEDNATIKEAWSLLWRT